MQYISRLSLISFLFAFANIGFAQEADTLRLKHDMLKLPFDRSKKEVELMYGNEQIGFGKILIDTTPQTYTIRQQIIDSAYRSVSLYMALNEKDFQKWERQNYPQPKVININWNFGPPPAGGGATGFNLAGIFRAVFGKNYGRDRWQMTAEERLKFEEEWKRDNNVAANY